MVVVGATRRKLVERTPASGRLVLYLEKYSGKAAWLLDESDQIGESGVLGIAETTDQRDSYLVKESV